MKLKLMIVALMVACVALFAGCATNAAQPLSPAQVAAVACPQLKLVGTQLQAFNSVLIGDPATQALGTKANADLAAIAPAVDAVCAAGATVTATNLQALAQQALPALGAIVGSLPLPPAQEAQIQGALVLAETAAGLVGVVESQIKAAQAAPAAAASSP
ncbi:hypothetical protein ISN76_12995 [Dyella halodurans]|uniref:Lipoprotein n=1 Tax=Dyella halodurans TaxID=1920171 RepID=A0ABV9C1P3_9GAMM|nr:hypothetical protein [Dyella halodurans]